MGWENHQKPREAHAKDWIIGTIYEAYIRKF